MKKKENVFYDAITELFLSVDEYKEDVKRQTVSFVMSRAEFNAEDLFKIAGFLGTGTIGIECDTRNGGYCDTCSYEYGVMVWTATNVKFPEAI